MGIGQNYGTIDIDVFEKGTTPATHVGFEEDLDRRAMSWLKSLEGAFSSLYGSSRTNVGVLLPFDSVVLANEGSCIVKTVRIYDNCNNHGHEIEFSVRSTMVPYHDPKGIRPLEGRPGLLLSVKAEPLQY